MFVLFTSVNILFAGFFRCLVTLQWGFWVGALESVVFRTPGTSFVEVQCP